MAEKNGLPYTIGMRRGLPEEVAAIIIKRIEDGEYELGDVLPSEQAMADTYQVSRTVVREALARLKYEGIIMSKRGSGPIVCGTISQKDFDFDIGGDVLTALTFFFEFRLITEGEAAALAALRHTAADAAIFADYLAQRAKGLENGSTEPEQSFTFHCIISDACGNAYINAFTRMLSTRLWLRVQSMRSLSGKLHEPPELVYAEQEAICRAILSHDPRAARLAAQDHVMLGAARQGVELETRFLCRNYPLNGKKS